MNGVIFTANQIKLKKEWQIKNPDKEKCGRCEFKPAKRRHLFFDFLKKGERWHLECFSWHLLSKQTCFCFKGFLTGAPYQSNSECAPNFQSLDATLMQLSLLAHPTLTLVTYPVLGSTHAVCWCLFESGCGIEGAASAVLSIHGSS